MRRSSPSVRPTSRRSTSPRPTASPPAERASTRPSGSSNSPRVAAAIGGAMGATRVITDRGWVGHERQIGTTGVVVGPELYVAFGISGAVQHTSGLGDPRHVISVNIDPYCPMMQMSDLAVVSDANAVLDELERAARDAAPMTDVDVVVVGAGPAGACAATVLARKGRSVLLLERGPFPGSKNMYGGVVYPRMLDLSASRVVGRRAVPAMDHASFHDAPDRVAGLDARLPHRSVGTSAVQRHDGLPARLRPLAGTQGRGRRGRVAVLHHRDRAAPRRRSGGRRADRPARRRRDRRRRDRLRRCQQLPGQGGRPLRRRRRQQLHTRRQRDDRPAEGRHRRAVRGA